MGSDATASLNYGFIIPQPKVLKLLQKLQNRTEPVENFGYGNGSAGDLEELLYKHLAKKGLDEDLTFSYLTAGEDEFEGLAILFREAGEKTMVWGFGSQAYNPMSSETWNTEEVEDANAAFKILSEDSLFKKLKIKVNPGWLLGCGMTC